MKDCLHLFECPFILKTKGSVKLETINQFYRTVIHPLTPYRNMIMRELAPQFHIPWSIPMEAEDIPIVPTTSGTM